MTPEPGTYRTVTSVYCDNPYRANLMRVHWRQSVVRTQWQLYLQVIQRYKHKSETWLWLEQTWHGQTRLTYSRLTTSIHDREQLQANGLLNSKQWESQWHEQTNRETRHMTKTTNEHITQWTREPMAWIHEGKGSMTLTAWTNYKIKEMKTRHETEPQNRPYYIYIQHFIFKLLLFQMYNWESSFLRKNIL